MVLKCGSESTDYQWYQIHEIDRALGTMRKYGISELSAPYQELYRLRGSLLGQIGVLKAKPVTQLIGLAGFSPGVIRLWHDSEVGWMSEARARTGAPPSYKRVSDEVAMAILKGEVTPELERELMAPDEYLGE